MLTRFYLFKINLYIAELLKFSSITLSIWQEDVMFVINILFRSDGRPRLLVAVGVTCMQGQLQVSTSGFKLFLIKIICFPCEAI